MTYEYKILASTLDPTQRDQLQTALNGHAQEGFRAVQVMHGPKGVWILIEKEKAK